MKFLEVLKKFDGIIVKENKTLKSAYATLLKEAEEDEKIKEAEEDVEEACTKEAEDEENKTDEAEDEEVEEADGMVSAEEFFKDSEDEDADKTDEAEDDKEDVDEADGMVSAEEFFKDSEDDSEDDSEEKTEESEDDKSEDDVEKTDEADVNEAIDNKTITVDSEVIEDVDKYCEEMTKKYKGLTFTTKYPKEGYNGGIPEIVVSGKEALLKKWYIADYCGADNEKDALNGMHWKDIFDESELSEADVSAEEFFKDSEDEDADKTDEAEDDKEDVDEAEKDEDDKLAESLDTFVKANRHLFNA